MFYLCVLRFSGNPLTSSDPLGGGTLLDPNANDGVSWYGAAGALATGDLLPQPQGVQWISFDDQSTAQAWVTASGTAALLGCSLVSGYSRPAGNTKLAVVVHRWQTWGDANPQPICVNCPPNSFAGNSLPLWFGQPLPGYSPATPVQTSVLLFDDAAALANFAGTTTGKLYLANTLCAQRQA
ncbi:hypothetical protein KGA65_16590 [Ideonella sp. B7]|uniref:hypothetical protein n=1 Tax=Ideonella benzenivorans TaxID=2831643 RepID=UPI001CEDFD81|nr:hypothetical protein [Ideonella benzenivorans]MCA6218154.1 hypothetical protein [Ideonella benzenivorans]